MKATIGDNIILKCHSHGDTRWFFNSFSSPLMEYKSDLIINNATSLNYGNYHCYGQSEKTREFFIASIKLQVFGNKLILLQTFLFKNCNLSQAILFLL